MGALTVWHRFPGWSRARVRAARCGRYAAAAKHIPGVQVRASRDLEGVPREGFGEGEGKGPRGGQGGGPE